MSNLSPRGAPSCQGPLRSATSAAAPAPCIPRVGSLLVDDCGDGDLRCHCGSLLARWVGGEIELRCRRCKRTFRLPVEAETKTQDE
jgi:phage FluMu protein Com